MNADRVHHQMRVTATRGVLLLLPRRKAKAEAAAVAIAESKVKAAAWTAACPFTHELSHAQTINYMENFTVIVLLKTFMKNYVYFA